MYLTQYLHDLTRLRAGIKRHSDIVMDSNWAHFFFILKRSLNVVAVVLLNQLFTRLAVTGTKPVPMNFVIILFEINVRFSQMIGIFFKQTCISIKTEFPICTLIV